MTAEPRVWWASIYVTDSGDVTGALQPRKRLHWKRRTRAGRSSSG